jgi:hypothetical protein
MRRSALLFAGLAAGWALTAAAAAFAFPASPGPNLQNDMRPLASPVPRQTVRYDGPYEPGTIIISTKERRLYFVLPDHQALKYGVGVGRPGFTWSGVTRRQQARVAGLDAAGADAAAPARPARWSIRSAGRSPTARVGHRPLRLPLRLLHVGGHDLPAQARRADARGARPAVLGLRRAGVRKLRITGGEPLVRRGIMTLFRSLSRHLDGGALDELTLTTNGSQLARYAGELRCGVRGSTSRSTRSTRRSSAPSRAGATRPGAGGHRRGASAGSQGQDQRRRAEGRQRRRSDRLIAWAHGRGFDLTFIEVMPLGRDRARTARPVSAAVAELRARWSGASR